MARIFLSGIDAANIPLIHLRLENLASAPGSPGVGSFYYDTALGAHRVYNGSAWKNPFIRSDHTGTQTASTISDLSTTVQGYTLNQFAAPTASVSFNSQKITNLLDPTLAQDAATMNWVTAQVQSAAAGISSKDPVRAVATTNQATMSGAATIDGVSLVAGDRVLLTAQTTATQNGPWVIQSGAWTRPTNTEGAQWELDKGALWLVLEGTSYAGTQFRITNIGVLTPGTTAIAIAQFSSSNPISAGNGILNTSGTFSIKLGSNSGLTVDGTGLYLTNVPSAGNGITLTGGSIAVNPAAGGGITVAAGGVSLTYPITAAAASGIVNTNGALTLNVKAGGGLTVDSTGLYLTTQFSAGNGIINSSGVLSVNPASGGGILVAAGGVSVDTTIVARKYAAAIGDGTSTTLTVTHNLNTRDVTATCYLSTAPYNEVEVDKNRTTVNTVDFVFATAPTSGQYRVVVTG